MKRIAALLFILALATPLVARPTIKASLVFLEAHRCYTNGTVDYGCFQQKLAKFEPFVLSDDASWLQKFIVADALVKTYDALHIVSPTEHTVRAKAAIYDKALLSLDKGELGQLNDCRDEFNPDGCLNARYCFKEAYIKIKNVLVTTNPEMFQEEIKWFDREIRGSCQMGN